MAHIDLNARSRRLPRLHAHSNPADKIEKSLQTDGHRIWGFVIYRCASASESEWEEFMKRFRARTHKNLSFYNALDMLDSLAPTVFADESTQGDSSMDTIRARFRDWAATAPEQEQGVSAASSPRYQFCIYVDAAALDSVINQALPPLEPDPYTPGFVNLIWRDWDPAFAGVMEEGYDLIDGSDFDDVGWMRVEYQHVMLHFYDFLMDPDVWEREYRRPPEIARA